MAPLRLYRRTIDSLQLRLNLWREVALFALMVMELSWFVPWFLRLASTYRPVPAARGFAVFTALFLAAHLLARLLDALHLPASLSFPIFLSFLLASSLAGLQSLVYFEQGLGLSQALARLLASFNDPQVALPLEFIALLAILLVSQRGALLARVRLDPAFVARSFWVGVVMIALFGTLSLGDPWELAGLLFFGFIASGLLAMISSRLFSLNRLRGGSPMPFERSRLSGALGIALGMACLAMLAAFSMKVDFLFAGLTGVYLLLLRLLVIVFALLFSPFLLLMYFFIPYLGSRIPGLPLTQKLMELVLDMQKLFSGLEPEGKPWFLDRQQLVLWASLLFVFLLALLLAYRLWSKRSEQDSGLQGAGLVLLSGGEDWLGLLRKGLGGLPSRLGNFAAYGPGHRRRAAARIRQIYAELMDLSARLGQARPGSQTPLEFQPALQDLFSGLAAEISTITQAYVRVRYGQVPESAQELQAVENAWSRIAKEGRQKIRMNKRRPVKPGASMMR